MKNKSTKEFKFVGQIFKAVRKFHNLQQIDYSASLGVSQGTISKIESGTMSLELALWFKFLDVYAINDPYTCENGGVELGKNALDTLKTEGSKLAPSFNFKSSPNIFDIIYLRPLYDLLENKHAFQLKWFLKENKISPEIFYILNHPVTFEFADSFFSLLEKCKINIKSIPILDLGFSTTITSTQKNINLIGNEISFIQQLNPYFFDYKINKLKSTYSVETRMEFKDIFGSLDNRELILQYGLLYPYHFLKYKNKASTSVANLKQDRKSSLWEVRY